MTSLTARIARNLQEFDWALIKSSALVSAGTALARVLGLAFSLVLAAVFSASDYGSIRYSIAVASLVAIGTMPFGQHVIARFVGREKEDREKVDRSLSNIFIVLPILFVATLLIAIPVLSYLGIPSLGVLVIFAGETLFYAYWGLSSGFQEPIRFTTSYLGSNLVQIILTVLLIQILGIHSPTLALLIYGLSYLLPVALLVIFWPLPFHLIFNQVRPEIIGELLRFSIPIWISHACYTLYSSMDLLLLKGFVGADQLGAYSLSKTLSTMFLFVPTGISTLLMPKVAALPKHSHRQILIRMLGVSLLVNFLVLTAYLPFVGPFTQKIFGSEYFVGPGISFLLALGMIASGIHTLITAVFVGSGRPEVESASRIMALVATALGSWVLIPPYGITGAAITMLVGQVVALLTYGFLMAAKISFGSESQLASSSIGRE